MKNIKKAIKNEAMMVAADVGISVVNLVSGFMAHLPGGARDAHDVLRRVYDKPSRFTIDGTRFTILELCREISKNGEESLVLGQLCRDNGRDARRIANLMRRIDVTYSWLGMVAMLEENEQLKEEES